jgi:hypothetical protein
VYEGDLKDIAEIEKFMSKFSNKKICKKLQEDAKTRKLTRLTDLKNVFSLSKEQVSVYVYLLK